jgi:hypothetical protein
VFARYATLPKHRQIESADMETITLADYVQYGFLAFIALLLVAMVVALIRQSGAIGELKGEVRGINLRLDEMSKSHSERMDALTTRVGRLEDGLSTLAREVSEIKGLLLALHQRVDLVMRHRHEPETGQVILTPEEIAAD